MSTTRDYNSQKLSPDTRRFAHPVGALPDLVQPQRDGRPAASVAMTDRRDESWVDAPPLDRRRPAVPDPEPPGMGRLSAIGNVPGCVIYSDILRPELMACVGPYP